MKLINCFGALSPLCQLGPGTWALQTLPQIRYCFQALRIITQFLFKSRVENETWLKKSTKISHYDKFFCNIFGWDAVKIGFSLVSGFKIMSRTRISPICVRIVNLLVVKGRQGLGNYIKIVLFGKYLCLVDLKIYVV